MNELTYDIAPADQSVISEEDLKDSEKAVADKQNEFPVAEPVHGSSPAPTPGWTEAARFQPAPRPDPFPFLDEESVPTEEDKRDALVKLSPNSGLSEEEADKYATTLKKYYEAEDAEALAQKKDNLKAQYRTPDGLLQITKDPVVRQEMDMSPDDDLVAKRALNRNYLAIMYDKPNASPEELDALMREHSIKHWGINNPSQETFYTKTREDIAKSDEETKVYRSAAKEVAMDVLGEELTNKRTSSSERFERVAKANPKVITAQNRDQWYQTMVLMEDRIRHLSKNARFPAATILDLANKMTTGEPTEIDWNRGINALRNINPNDLKQALKIASIAGRELDPTGGMVDTVVSNLSKRFGRDYTLRQGELADSKRTLSEIQEKAAAGKLQIGEDANGKPYFAMDGRPLPAWVTPVDPGKYAEHVKNLERETEGIRIIQTLQNFQEQVRDPVTPYFKGGLLGMAEGGVYDVAGFSKLLPLGLVRGPAGLMTMAKVIGDKYFLDLTYQNPDLNIRTASQMSSLMGLAESLGMKFKAEFLVGNYAIFKSMRTLSGTGKSLEAFKVFAKWNLVHQAEENFEELAQDTTSATIQKLFADANPRTMKQESWNDLISDIATTRLQVAFAVAPLSMIGAGNATIRDLRNPMRDFMNPDALKSVGLSEEQVAEVMGAGGLEGAEKVFRKHYNTLTPEAIKAGFEYAAGLGEQAEVDAAMADPVLPSIEPTILPDGTYKYNVIDADGKILSSHTDPDAAEMAWIRETERVNDEHAASMQDQANQQAAQQAEAEAAAAASDEGIEKEAEAKATAETVSPEDRLGTALTVDFEEHATPTEAESREVAQLQADVRAAGRADTIIRARPSDIQTSAGKATLGFVRAFEKLTGKRVVFVASGTDQPLSFTGAVRPGDPNTIFLDAHGDRNILALVGHEWSHTLEKTNPALHAEMLGKMKGAIVDWAKQEGILAQEVDAANVTNEMVANIVGDAIANEAFWYRMASQNPSLFTRVRDAVIKFINEFAGRLRSEFGTEVFADAQTMQGIVADVMQRAGAGPEAVEGAAAAGVSFAPSREEVSFANRRTEKGFYSKLENVVADKIPKTASADQVKATINGAGIKAEEIKWSGVMPTIDRLAAENAGKVPKGELVVHLEDEGSVKFEEVTLKELSGEEYQELQRRRQEIYSLRDRGGQISITEANRRLNALDREFKSEAPKYATYVLPGGENYREVVLAMPPGKPSYTSSHFPDVPNYVAHMRLNEREGGLFIEEIQSDRHQAGREKGYVEPEVRKRQQELLGRETLTDAEVAEIEALSKTKPGEIPDAPFRSDWHMAMFKRALRDAVALGQKWIGWTTGGTQYDRWGSEKFDWSPQPGFEKTHFLLSAQEQFHGEAGGVNMEELARERGVLLEQKGVSVNSYEEVLKVVRSVTREEDKAEGMAEKLWKKMQEKDSGTSLPRKEGMEYFYDTAMPSAVGKYVKQWGAKVEQGEVGQTGKEAREARYIVEQKGQDDWIVLDKDDLSSVGTYGSEQLARNAADIFNGNLEGKAAGEVPIWKIEITPQMKAGVTEGQALFAPRREQKTEARKEPAIAPGAKSVKVTVFDRQARGFVQKSMSPSRDLLNDLQREKNIYERLLKCL